MNDYRSWYSWGLNFRGSTLPSIAARRGASHLYFRSYGR